MEGKGTRNYEDVKKEEHSSHCSHSSNPKRQKLYGSSLRNPIMERSKEHKTVVEVRALAFKSENPFSELIFMTPNIINYRMMYVRSSFAELLRPFTSHKGDITLRISADDGSVRTWQLRTMYYSRERLYLTVGWTKFTQENNLKKGDWCAFKLIEEANGAIIEVVIFRDNIADYPAGLEDDDDDTGFYEISGFKHAETDSSDNAYDPSLFHFDDSDDEDDVLPHVSSTSSRPAAVGSQQPVHAELSNVDERFVPLLEQVCSRHPSLVESKKKNTPEFTKWAFTALGEVLYFLKTKRVKDMTDDVCAGLELSWKELQAFQFDLSWLEPHVQRALAMNEVAKGTGKAKRLRKDVADLEEEAKKVRAKLEKSRRDLEEAEQYLEDINLDNQLGYEV